MMAILFISLFATDAFNSNLPIWQQLKDFAIHLVPSMILTIILIIAWKHELIGGIIFALIAVAFSPLIYLNNRNINHYTVSQSVNTVLLVAFPFFIVGGLFILSYCMKKKNRQKLNTS